ncbi:hypothetical protein HP532_20950 [Pseudomonas sp. CrR25]|nr:hypothetical protein [Pseudomonas sp. CrR25]
MRTLILVVLGLVLAMLVLRFTPAAHRILVCALFTLLWLGVSALNLRIGLSHGYTLAQELPVHALIFGMPTLAAWAAWWWLGR